MGVLVEDYVRRCRVIHVVDGDTVDMVIDLGYHMQTRQRVRLWGIDAPELFSGNDRERGAHARDTLQTWLASHLGHGGTRLAEWPMVVQTKKDTQTFGRYVGSIGCPAGHSTDDLPREWPGLFTERER